jgi:RimJ/RimL family protein N-acetyltransferase
MRNEIFIMDKPLFATERLMVRRWRDADLPALEAVYGDAGAMRFVGDGTPITRDGCLLWLEKTRNNYLKYGYGMFAVEKRDAPGVIGFCGIVHPNGQSEPELKYAYRRECWGQGFATEVLRGLIRYGTDVLGLSYMMATVAPAHAVSQKVLENAGMKQGPTRINDDGSSTLVFEIGRPPSGS